MTQKPKQAQAPARAEKPAIPTGMAEQPKSRTGGEKAIVELTDADLKAVSGGGGKGSGQGGDMNR